jgi:hypothetical protein
MASTPWDASGFQSIVGRTPTQAETDFYSKDPNWQVNVQNAAGGGAPAASGSYGSGYTTPQGQTNYGTATGGGSNTPTSTPQVQPTPAATPGGSGTMPGAGQAPSYVNMQDPTSQAVYQAFQAKGIQPRDQADFQYWVDKINQSGGLANGYQNSGGSGTWANRMASAQGGVGDYSTGGTPIQGGTMGNTFGDPRQISSGYSGTGTLMNGALGAGDANSLYADLLKRSQESLSFNPQTDAIARPQIDSFAASRARQDKDTLSQLAEGAGPNGNQAAATRAAGEASGQATAGFAGQLGQQEVAARRQEISQALSGAMGLLTSQQQMALQEELSNLDRAQQESQFGRSLANNAYQFDINDQYRNSPLSWA